MEKARVEAIAGPDRIDRDDVGWFNRCARVPLLNDSAPSAAFNHDQRDPVFQHIERLLQARFARDAFNLVLVGQENVDQIEKFVQHTAPLIGRVVVGIKRKSQA